MDEAEVVWRADANYQHVYSLLGSGHDGGEVREKDGLLLVNTGYPAPEFNNAFVTRPLAQPAKLLREAIDYYDGARLPFVVRIREGLDLRAERACEELGLPYSDTVPGMALAPIRDGASSAVGLDVMQAATDGDFAEFFRIVCEVFHFPVAAARTLFSPELLHRPDVAFFVGYVDGVAAATSTLVATHGAAGIFNVATMPEYRGRGIGEAMTWQCVRRGVEMGCSMATLQASMMGRPIYERMGFRLVSPYRTFHRPDV